MLTPRRPAQLLFFIAFASMAGLLSACGAFFRAGDRCTSETTLESCQCTENEGCQCKDVSCGTGVCWSPTPDHALCVVSKDVWPGCDESRGSETECDGNVFYSCSQGRRLVQLPGSRCSTGVCVPHDGFALCAISSEPWPACDPQQANQSLCDGDTVYNCRYGYRAPVPDSPCEAPLHCTSDGNKASCTATP